MAILIKIKMRLKEQKRWKRGIYGYKDQLIVKRTTIEECKNRKNLD